MIWEGFVYDMPGPIFVPANVSAITNCVFRNLIDERLFIVEYRGSAHLSVTKNSFSWKNGRHLKGPVFRMLPHESTGESVMRTEGEIRDLLAVCRNDRSIRDTLLWVLDTMAYPPSMDDYAVGYERGYYDGFHDRQAEEDEQ